MYCHHIHKSACNYFHPICLYFCYSGPAKDQTLYLCSRYKTPCLPSAFIPLFLHEVTAKVFKRQSYLQIPYHPVFTSLPLTQLSMSSDPAFIPGFQSFSSPVTVIQSLSSRVRLFVNPWPVAHQAPLSLGVPRQDYWSGLPLPPLGDLPTQGLNPRLLHWQVDSLPPIHLGSPHQWSTCC